MILALDRSGRFDVRVKSLHHNIKDEAFSANRGEYFKSLMRKPERLDAIQVYHCIPPLQVRVRRLAKSIGFATFETFEPPAAWIPTLNKCSAVICPSKFNEMIFKHAGVTVPVHHLPHCIDTEMYHPHVQAEPVVPSNDDFTFMFFGSWVKRKGWENLLEAYWQEFSSHDGVKLVMKTTREARQQREMKALREKLGLMGKDCAPIFSEYRVFDELRLPSLLKSADCLVFPTWGEGFGLPPLQCMALGVPVVATNFSGCQDYLNDNTGTLLEPDGFVMHQHLDHIHQFNDRKWAYVSVQTIRRAMRYVVENVDKVRRKAEFAAKVVAEEYGYRRAASDFDAVVGTLNAS